MVDELTATDPNRIPAGDWNELSGHVCGLFRSIEEQYHVMLPFIKGGLERGERAFHTLAPQHKQNHIDRLQSAGIDVAGCIATGQLIVNDWDTTFPHLHAWENMKTVNLFHDICRNGRELGYSRTRFFCEYQYAKLIQTTEEILEYEAVFQMKAFDKQNADDVTICAYHLPEWSGEVLVNALRTHPTVILGGHLHENPFFEAPSKVLEALEHKRTSRSCC